MTGLRTEVRGTPPTGEVMIAAKHQSFLDIMMIYNAVPRGKFIMKRELMFAPLWAIRAAHRLRAGQPRQARGRHRQDAGRCEIGQATGRAADHLFAGHPRRPGRQGPTRSAPALYEQLGQPCVPVATNVGVFWPRHGILRKPGLAVVEFLPPIPPGLTATASCPGSRPRWKPPPTG
jgi:1-acyl-sn-glycerol-3-phosphate acyltransferase